MNIKNNEKIHVVRPELELELDDPSISIEVFDNYSKLNEKCDHIISKIRVRKSKNKK